MANEQPQEIKADEVDDNPDRPDDKTDDQAGELRVVELGVDGQGVAGEDE